MSAPLRVLVAEDEPVQRRMLCAFLTGWGYRPEPVEDGTAALAALGAEDRPRLALVDWEMPGATGIDICRRARAVSGRPCYCLLLTVRNEVEDQLAGLEAGASDYIAKPWFPETMRCRVDVWGRIIAAEDERAEHLRRLAEYSASLEALAESRARALVHAERLASLGTLAAGVAHEINNPAAVVAGNAQLLARFWECMAPHLTAPAAQDRRLGYAVAEMPRALHAVEDAVGRIARIVRGLQQYARQDQGERRPTDLNACIEQSIELCAHRLRQVALERDLAPALPPVLANAQEVEQVLVNLLVNAADAVGEQGGRVRVASAAADGRVEVVVEDDGPGVPPDQRERIWQPFFTTKPVGKGTGLGLPISHGIVTGHGGGIRLEERPGGGARFVIGLPAAAGSR